VDRIAERIPSESALRDGRSLYGQVDETILNDCTVSVERGAVVGAFASDGGVAGAAEVMLAGVTVPTTSIL
jgi:hypothetical protein